MAYGRSLRACGAALTAGLVLAGCAGGGGGDGKPDGGARGGTTPSASASAPPSTAVPTATAYTFTPDPARVPKTPADAKRLALAVVAGPDAWGPDYVEGKPYLSTEGSWPVLPDTCLWEAGTLPATVLYSATTHSEIPAAGGKGRVRVTATVTIHRTADDADWEMAQTLEEALRCPAQTLREGERISGLMSIGDLGDAGNLFSEDSINERGKFIDDTVKGQHFYGWTQARVGQVTVAVSARGGPGHTDDDLSTSMAKASVTMINRVESQLGAK
ncbi:hypothetical protein ACFY8F_09930 [Streptomyces tanashiensis]|uniref:hypothetical protein n=1 Tax=Streptomyces tanashiensis TaxID=67367 RepID=UPI00367E83CF